ncbi:four helix bundle protein [Candidatus Peregrinibacteria bacterium]|nr:four helix bundle protein [Candidatus Peregrinibacteria bacterium]
MLQGSRRYDLAERTALFGELIIKICASVPATNITRSIVDQLVRSGTAIGANYAEANGASSRKDFRNKIHIAKKETQETLHWLRMLAAAVPDRKPEIRVIWKEAQELAMIFQKITQTLNKKPSPAPLKH